MPDSNDERNRNAAIDALAYMTAFLDCKDAAERGDTDAELAHWGTMKQVIESCDLEYCPAQIAWLFTHFAEGVLGSRDEFRARLNELGKLVTGGIRDA
jgi:hypothetical protein